MVFPPAYRIGFIGFSIRKKFPLQETPCFGNLTQIGTSDEEGLRGFRPSFGGKFVLAPR